MFMLLSKQATGNSHGPYRRPGSGGHHLGDPWFRLSTLGYQQVQCSLRHSCHVLESCYRHRANKFSKLINEGPLAILCHVSILPPSWRQNRYYLLYIMGRSRPEDMLQFGISGPGEAVYCQLQAGQAAKLLARPISADMVPATIQKHFPRKSVTHYRLSFLGTLSQNQIQIF